MKQKMVRVLEKKLFKKLLLTVSMLILVSMIPEFGMTALALDSGTSHTTELVNGGFEYPSLNDKLSNSGNWWYDFLPFDITGNTAGTYKRNNSTGIISDFNYNLFNWNTTAQGTSRYFEYGGIWNVSAWGVQFVPEGNQFIELNASTITATYQDLATTPGQIIYWSIYQGGVWYSNKTNINNTMAVRIGSQTQLIDATMIANAETAYDQSWTKRTIYDINSMTEVSSLPSVYIGKESNKKQLYTEPKRWTKYEGIYVVPEGQTVTRLAFASLSQEDPLSGNLIDGIVLQTATPEQQAELAVAITEITVTGANVVESITTNGGSLQMEAGITPNDATNKEVTWSVSDGTGSATISTSGLLTATKNGTVTVMAAAKDGSNVFGSKEIIISGQGQAVAVSATSTSPVSEGKVMLTVSTEVADGNHKLYYRVVDAESIIINVGDIITVDNWTEVTNTNSNVIDAVDGQYVEVVEITITDSKVTRVGKSIALDDGYEPNQDQTPPTNLIGVAPTTYGGNNGKIMGTTTDMEYKISTVMEWTKVNATEIAGLVAGTYQVRYAAKTGYHAGNASTVILGEGVFTPPYIPITPISTPTPTKVRRVIINGVGGDNGTDSDYTAVTVEVARQVTENKKVDFVVLDQSKTNEVLKKVKERNQNTVQIVVDEIPEDEADEVTVTINTGSVKELSDNKVALKVKTEQVSIQLSNDALQTISESEKDLFFRVIPIRDSKERAEVMQNAITAEAVTTAAGSSEILALGTPMTIETNYQKLTARVTFSLKDIKIPIEEVQRKEFLDSLGVYIHHSDGEKVLNRGTVKYDTSGNPVGLEIEINKFSTFTIVSIKNIAPTASNVKISGKGIVGNILSVSYIYNDVNKDEEGDSIIKWYRADDKMGKNKTLVSELKQLTYQVTKKDQEKCMIVEVTPVAKTGEVIGKTVSASMKVTVNYIPLAELIKISGKLDTGNTLTASYTYKDVEKDKEGKSSYRWYRVNNAKGDDKKAIKGANELTYTLTKEDIGKYIIFEVTPIATTGSKKGAKTIATTKKVVTESKLQYNTHVKLGVIGSKTYAETVAKIFQQEYQRVNVEVKKEGMYYQIFIDFTSKAAAQAACMDMIKRKYIVNYYFFEL